MPLVHLRPFETPIPELWAAAPSPLRKRATRPFRPLQGEVWKLLRDRRKFGAAVWPNVPVWVARYEVGYVLDFFLPKFGVNVQIEPWEPCFDNDVPPQIDIDAFPDHPLNFERPTVLQEIGIETLSYYEDASDPQFARHVFGEIRRELGFGRPPWLRRHEFSSASTRCPP